eukprot:80951-Prorocentrum_lima.AAC.1
MRIHQGATRPRVLMGQHQSTPQRAQRRRKRSVDPLHSTPGRTGRFERVGHRTRLHQGPALVR